MDHSFPAACTAVQLTSAEGAPYWLRTCDLDSDIFAGDAHLVGFPAGDFVTLSCGSHTAKHAFMGMTLNGNPSWLLDGINSAGLSGGLLMLYEGTSLPAHPRGIMGMELVTLMLAECADTDDVLRKAEDLRILDVPHGGSSVSATMHYFFTDLRGKCIVLEAADPKNKGKLTAYAPSVGVLTNSPPYPAQIDNLRWFLAHSHELRGKELVLEEQIIVPAPDAPHLCSSGTFPASYAAYDRFVRAAVLKGLNDRRFSEKQMHAGGYNLMHALFEPPNDGLLHYTQLHEKTLQPIGSKDSSTQYIIIYDIRRRSLMIRPHDALVWSSLHLGTLPDRRCRFSVCRDPQKGIYPLN